MAMNRRRELGIFLTWTAMGLLESGKAYVYARLRGGDPTLVGSLIGNMPWWYGWAALTPVAFALAARFRIDRPPVGRRIAVHVVAAGALSVIHLFAVGMLFFHTRPTGFPSFWKQFDAWTDNFLMLDMLTYVAIVGAWYAMEYYGRARRSELSEAQLEARAAQLESRMTAARLDALRMELNPHFLFNTLNAISGLVRRKENEAAVQTLARLGDLLRATLDREGEQEVPLDVELDFLRLYLEIERIRYGDRLTVSFGIEPGTVDALGPTLILQPLVENAVRHGIAKKPGPGRIEIDAFRAGEDLVLRVMDTGSGFGTLPTNGERGVGLSNTRARIEELYGAGARLDLANGDDGGAMVTVVLPFHEATQPAGGTP
jgi:signal transduction histidine kinase